MHRGVSELDASAWDALLPGGGGEPSPFLEHAFLSSLEDGGTLGPARGWIPQLLVLSRAGRPVAAAPAYVKLHSQGEFVFDFAFADLAARLGLRYYPKLLVAVPFTPATGRRLLTHPAEDRPALLRALARALLELAAELGVSGIHVNFLQEDELAALAEAGFEERHGLQYHWRRGEAASFEDYLARFTSKKRNQLRRELRAIAEEHVSIRVVRGEALRDPALAALAFRLYKSTIDKLPWGRQYLEERVFHLWAERCSHRLELVLAEADGRVVAGAVNFAGARRLYGRYWGALEERRFLHFAVCYYQGVEECCRRGFEVFEPGAGGEHKLARGFEPVITRSAHWLRDTPLRAPVYRFLREERVAIAAEREQLLAPAK